MNQGCVIFDLDGTLIDSRRDLAVSVNLLRRERGLAELPEETVVSFVGNGAAKLLERAFAGYPEFKPEELLAGFKRIYRENLVVHTTLYPGAADGVKQLAEAGFRPAVSSNKPAEFCREILEKFGIGAFFGTVLGGGTEIPLKPAPDSLLRILEVEHASPSKSWMVGDNWTDLAAGRAAGMRTCCAAWGFGNPKDEPFDFRAETFPEFTRHVLSA